LPSSRAERLADLRQIEPPLASPAVTILPGPDEDPALDATPMVHPEEHVVGVAGEAPGLLDRFAAVRRFDEAVDDAFDVLRGNPVTDRAFYGITELGDFGLIWALLGGARALVGDEADERDLVRLLVALGAESVLVNGVIKSLFRRERPVIQEPRPHRIRIPLTTSFPSGHASTAMLAASLLSDGRAGGRGWYALGVWVASSRVYVRIHHASDVVAGLGLGLALGATARRIWPSARRR
jgi:undecaprenyl-diphosphatase